MTSTNPKTFYLKKGQVSVGLARDRLWQVKDGRSRLLVMVSNELVGEMSVPESGWFAVPESEYLRVQLVADSPISFESRLPLGLVPRLGDLGRSQLIQPIREMMSVAGIDDHLVDWNVKLAQPSFRSWVGESIDRAILSKKPMSPDVATPLIIDKIRRETVEHDLPREDQHLIWILSMVAMLSILSVVNWLGALIAMEAAGFSLSFHYGLVAAGCLGFISCFTWIIHYFASLYKNVRLVGISSALLMTTLILLFEAPVLAISLFFSGSLIAGAYWVYVRRLLPGLPAIDKPMRWLSLRLAHDGVPSVRARVVEVWDQARQWVIARIELVAEYSRFSRSVIAASLVIPAIASTDNDRPIVLTGLALAAVILLERLRAAMPISIETRTPETGRSPAQPLYLSGDVHYQGIVYRRHAGDRPLFDQLNFHCTDDSLVRITAVGGTGLSTLKHLLTRQVSPERGVVSIGGMDIARIDPQLLLHSIVMLDHPREHEASTVGEWLFIDPGMEPSRLEMHLHALSASRWIEVLNKRLDAPLGALQSMAGPHGLNRLKLARALSRQGQIMWLDNWLVGLSYKAREHVIQSLVERSGTRFVVDSNGLFKGHASIHWEIARD